MICDVLVERMDGFIQLNSTASDVFDLLFRFSLASASFLFVLELELELELEPGLDLVLALLSRWKHNTTPTFFYTTMNGIADTTCFFCCFTPFCLLSFLQGEDSLSSSSVHYVFFLPSTLVTNTSQVALGARSFFLGCRCLE